MFMPASVIEGKGCSNATDAAAKGQGDESRDPSSSDRVLVSDTVGSRSGKVVVNGELVGVQLVISLQRDASSSVKSRMLSPPIRR